MVPKIIQICGILWQCSVFLPQTGNKLFGKIGPKQSSYKFLFKLLNLIMPSYWFKKIFKTPENA